MRFLYPIFRGVSIEMPPLLGARSVAAKVAILCLPFLIIGFIIIFFIMGRNINDVVDRAITRGAQFQAGAISISIEHLLRDARNQLLLLAASATDSRAMTKAMKQRLHGGGLPFREVSFIGNEPEARYVLLACGDEIVTVPQHVAWEAPGGPFNSSAQTVERGHVGISKPLEVGYPLVPVGDSLKSVELQILRFSTSVYDDNGQFKGILSLSIDLDSIQDRISRALNSGDGGNAEKAQGQSFFFDRDGWMMFQAESPQAADGPMRQNFVRDSFKGSFGRPGFSKAFRPAAEHLNYWIMIADIQSGRSGILSFNNNQIYAGDDAFTGTASYAPVTFETREGANSQVIGGIALVDGELSGASAWRRLSGIYFCAFAACVFLASVCLFWFSRAVAKRLKMIAGHIERANADNSVDAISLPPMASEFDKLCAGINAMFSRMKQALQAERNNAAARTMHKKRQPVADLPSSAVVHASDLVGESPQMRNLYKQIEKAAQVSADVLVIGETGTGKELVSLSIHKLSDRRDGPFISINCGALDEALLMDTLFGHVRGAFTEARSDRKGAFLAASGGTLLLDEIGNAPHKVQQALLRALSTRQIRPLGSDSDINFDARVIAATNAPLSDDRQDFRNDLYYRLAVITIETPPLRAHKEDIYPLLAHFLEIKAKEYGFADAPALSYGALEKLLAHNWPGNVREFRNTISRALTFCNGKIILADDLNLSDSETDNACLEYAENGEEPEDAANAAFPPAILQSLNKRQRDLWPSISSLASFTRQDYQKLAGENISQRTAQYDLRIMMRLGLLSRSGKGPQQRYSPKYASDGSQLNAMSAQATGPRRAMTGI